MSISIWRECRKVCCQDAGHDRVGNQTLEAPGTLPSASSAKVALHASDDSNYNAIERGTTSFPLGCPP